MFVTGLGLKIEAIYTEVKRIKKGIELRHKIRSKNCRKKKEIKELWQSITPLFQKHNIGYWRHAI